VSFPLAENVHQMSPLSPELKRHESRMLKEKKYLLVGTNNQVLNGILCRCVSFHKTQKCKIVKAYSVH
jgi:hypothetical protein